jgi:hypothetical protein
VRAMAQSCRLCVAGHSSVDVVASQQAERGSDTGGKRSGIAKGWAGGKPPAFGDWPRRAKRHKATVDSGAER